MQGGGCSFACHRASAWRHGGGGAWCRSTTSSERARQACRSSRGRTTGHACSSRRSHIKAEADKAVWSGYAQAVVVCRLLLPAAAAACAAVCLPALLGGVRELACCLPTVLAERRLSSHALPTPFSVQQHAAHPSFLPPSRHHGQQQTRRRRGHCPSTGPALSATAAAS